MPQQQFLLIVLGIIVISLAIAMGLVFFTDQASAANRDALTTDLSGLATRVQQYYRRPQVQGGGGRSFEGITMEYLTSRGTNINGSYTITSVSSNKLQIQASGRELSPDGSPLSVTMTVFPDSTYLVFNN